MTKKEGFAMVVKERIPSRLRSSPDKSGLAMTKKERLAMVVKEGIPSRL
jgi:hypothetical protein